jgi:AraC-like DNA-binding protein
MDVVVQVLRNMIIPYFQGIEWGHADHVSACRAWIDRDFPDRYALNFANGGRIAHAVDGASIQTLDAPVAWWTWPGPTFTYGAIDGEPWDHFYVSFLGPRAERMAFRGLLPCNAPGWATIRQPERLRQEFTRLITMLRERPADNPHAVLQLENLLLLVQDNEDSLPHRPSMREGILQCIRDVRDTPGRQVDWEIEARRLSLSVVHFRRLFRKQAGMPPQAFLIKARLERAALLLRTTRMPVKQVADEAGYADIYHFSRHFRKQHGIPPATYRREMCPAEGPERRA